MLNSVFHSPNNKKKELLSFVPRDKNKKIKPKTRQSECVSTMRLSSLGQANKNKKNDVRAHLWLVHLTYRFVSLLSIGDIHCRASGSTKPCIATDGNDSIKLSCKSYVKNTYIKYSTLFAIWNPVCVAFAANVRE